jgi:3-oxoacyl-[acyl-carrier-protein] synthase-3
MSKRISAMIAGTGSYLPEKILTNQDFEKILDTSDEWIVTRTGVRTRHVVAEGEGTRHLAAMAARRALDDSGIAPSEIDMLIVGTFTGEHPLPATACLVQQDLGLGHCAAFDVAAACSGFLYALTVGRQFIETGMYRNVLVVGAESLTRFTDYTDRGSCILFGDGAGAAVLTANTSDDRGVKYNKLQANGGGWDMLYVKSGGSLRPASAETVANREHYIVMHGREIYKFAVQTMQDLLEDGMKQCGLTAADVAMVVPHQVNIRIIESACSHSGFPMDKVYVNLDRTGNTSSASIPIALDQARREGKIKTGDTIIMAAFGAGLTWASAVVKM